ncbi:MAG: hypothetical protein IPN72_06865 [Saprospiraceae bacterium]|nr:hypothetical protein [Saprospiraceae bacterium]
MDGTLVETLEKADISRLLATGWKAPTPIKVKSEDGKWDLYGLMFTPTHLDKNKDTHHQLHLSGPQGGGSWFAFFQSGRSDNQALEGWDL